MRLCRVAGGRRQARCPASRMAGSPARGSRPPRFRRKRAKCPRTLESATTPRRLRPHRIGHRAGVHEVPYARVGLVGVIEHVVMSHGDSFGARRHDDDRSSRPHYPRRREQTLVRLPKLDIAWMASRDYDVNVGGRAQAVDPSGCLGAGAKRRFRVAEERVHHLAAGV